MKQWIIYIIFLFAYPGASAQQRFNDSLKSLLAASKDDTTKINLYSDLALSNLWLAPDSAFAYSVTGLMLAQKNNYKLGEVKMLYRIGEAFNQRGNFPKALETQFKAVELAKQTQDHYIIQEGNIWIAKVYFQSSDFEQALHYFRKAYQSQLLFYGDPGMVMSFIGDTFLHLNQLDSALWYTQNAYDIDLRTIGDVPSPFYYILGSIYERKGDIGKALELYRAAIKVEMGRVHFSFGYNRIASAFRLAGQLDSSTFYARKVVDGGAAFPANVIEAGELLVGIYKSKHVTDSALKYQDIVIAAKDSLFSREKVMQMQGLAFSEQLHELEVKQAEQQYKNRLRTNMLTVGVIGLLLLAGLLFRNNRYRQRTGRKIELAYERLKATQAQLIQSEKMASLGEMTAGIAHEIQNPLNFVNNFAEVNRELIEEFKILNSKVKTGEITGPLDEDLLTNIDQNLEKIALHGKRADAIVKSMLQHSVQSKGQMEKTDVNILADEYLKLSYNGFKIKNKSFDSKVETNFHPHLGMIDVIPQDIGRVLVNVYNNALYAVAERKRTHSEVYEPIVTVSTKKNLDRVEIWVEDNGMGIPDKVKDKIFQPFFTTKPTGQGTGLGLSLSYDIIKAHGGEIRVESKEGEGTTMIISIPG
jgi:two-component system, NtrC family, sensor kinase